jgi:hypothetical protein
MTCVNKISEWRDVPEFTLHVDAELIPGDDLDELRDSQYISDGGESWGAQTSSHVP